MAQESVHALGSHLRQLPCSVVDCDLRCPRSTHQYHLGRNSPSPPPWHAMESRVRWEKTHVHLYHAENPVIATFTHAAMPTLVLLFFCSALLCSALPCYHVDISQALLSLTFGVAGLMLKVRYDQNAPNRYVCHPSAM